MVLTGYGAVLTNEVGHCGGCGCLAVAGGVRQEVSTGGSSRGTCAGCASSLIVMSVVTGGIYSVWPTTTSDYTNQNKRIMDA